MGAIWGDPYTIGGKRGTIPPASLSRVYSSPPAEGLPLGCPWVWVPMAPKGGLMMPENRGVAEDRGFADLRCLAPPRGGPDGTPLYWGGVVL